MAGRASPQARPRGRHFLRSRAFADELVRDARIAPGSLVLDLGAGGGVLTRALADARARVRAVELDPAALQQLRVRFGDDPRVEVVEGDATVVRQVRYSPNCWKMTLEVPSREPIEAGQFCHIL